MTNIRWFHSYEEYKETKQGTDQTKAKQTLEICQVWGYQRPGVGSGRAMDHSGGIRSTLVVGDTITYIWKSMNLYPYIMYSIATTTISI